MSFIESNALEPLRGAALFYPGAGEDYSEPLELFVPAVTEFWFVDINYFTQNDAYDVAPLIEEKGAMRFSHYQVTGPSTAKLERRQDFCGPSYPFIKPCTRTELYIHLATRQRITVYRRRGFGECSISLVPDIGVFFHRGDSPGDGGSNVRWLSKRRCLDVLTRLRDGGLVVSDGSLADVKQLRRFHRKDLSPQHAYERARPFEKWGRSWTCVGWAHMRYGPTLVWKLCKT